MNFVKDTAMRGMISSKSQEEAGNNIATFIKETAKVMKTYGGSEEKVEEGGKTAKSLSQ